MAKNALFGNQIVEYAGYQPPKQPDWGKVFDEAEADISTVITNREKERALNEEIFSTTEAALKDFTTGVNTKFQEYVGYGLNANRDYTMEMYKKLKNNEIDSTQYTMALNRVKQDWSEFGEFSKNFEERLAEIETRRTSSTDPSSIIEYDYFGSKIAGASDFGNKRLVVDPASGGLYSISYNEKGQAVKSSVIGTQELNNFQRQKVNKVDLTNKIADYTKRMNDTELKSVIMEGGIKSAETLSQYLKDKDPRFAAQYDNFVKSVEDAIMQLPPNQVASALADNVEVGKMENGKPVVSDTGNWIIYDNPNDFKKGGKHYGKDKAFGVLMTKQEDGSMGADLTDDQKEYLRSKTHNIIDSQLGYKETWGVDRGEEELALKQEELKRRKEKDKQDAKIANRKLNLANKELKQKGKGEKMTYLPYSQMLDSFEAKDASRIKANDKIVDAYYTQNGDELIVQYKGTDKKAGTTESFSTQDLEGQKAIARLLFPKKSSAEVDTFFDADYAANRQKDKEKIEMDKEITPVMSIKVQDPEGKKTSWGMDEFINEDWERSNNKDKKLQYIQGVALNSGYLKTDDVKGLTIGGLKGDEMQLIYTSPDGKVRLESPMIPNDPWWNPNSFELQAIEKQIADFLNQIRNETYGLTQEEAAPQEEAATGATGAVGVTQETQVDKYGFPI